MPVRLGNDAHLEPAGNQRAANQRGAKRGMVNVRIARDDDDIELMPAKGTALGLGNR